MHMTLFDWIMIVVLVALVAIPVFWNGRRPG